MKFEQFLNFKGVQTFWEKSHKFPKILSWGDIDEHQFCWSHLYGWIWSFYTSAPLVWFENKTVLIWIWISKLHQVSFLMNSVYTWWG
jgi:hypothetical protein